MYLSSFTVSAMLSLNQDMLWATDDGDESVMWECHQSLGTVTAFCLSAQTEDFSAHFTIAAMSLFFLPLLSYLGPHLSNTDADNTDVV